VRNVDHFLAESIESVLARPTRTFKFIIVDFGSTDSCSSIVSRYANADDRLRLQVMPESGLAEAGNVGCLLARGQYIAIMDADDVCVPDRVKSEVEFMEAHPICT
jgi:glycosyltransferase involved in cell wall biosynthesis